MQTTIHTVLRIQGTITASSTAATSTAISPALSGSNDWASFSALYDEFRIDSASITLNFQPILVGTSTTYSNGIATAIDPNASNAVSFANLSDYQNFVLHPITTVRPFVVRSFPVVAPHNAAGVLLPAWQPMDGVADVFGPTVLLSTASTINSAGTVPIPYVLTYRVSFRMRR
jgi:hypothetical protein